MNLTFKNLNLKLNKISLFKYNLPHNYIDHNSLHQTLNIMDTLERTDKFHNYHNKFNKDKSDNHLK